MLYFYYVKKVKIDQINNADAYINLIINVDLLAFLKWDRIKSKILLYIGYHFLHEKLNGYVQTPTSPIYYDYTYFLILVYFCHLVSCLNHFT